MYQAGPWVERRSVDGLWQVAQRRSRAGRVRYAKCTRERQTRSTRCSRVDGLKQMMNVHNDVSAHALQSCCETRRSRWVSAGDWQDYCLAR